MTRKPYPKMKSIILTLKLTFDEKDWYTDKVESDWFFSHVLKKDLVLHSNDIGDSIGDVEVLDVCEA